MPEKIQVEILNEQGIKKSKKYPVRENTIVIEKGKRGRGGHAGWNPKFTEDCFIYYKKRIVFWKILKRKLMVKEGADKCINFNKKVVDVPSWDANALREAGKAEAIIKAGATIQKLEIPIMIWLLLAAILMIQVIALLTQSGRIRFG